MSNPSTDRVRGDLLCAWRTSQKRELDQLAQSANLSVAQIRELESGGSRLFYTPAIKEAAARKVAHLLGGDPEEVIAKTGDPPLTVLPSVVDDLVTLTCKPLSYASSVSTLRRHSALLYLPVLLVLGFLSSGWLIEQWQNGGEQQFWKKTSFANETTAQLVSFAAPSLSVPAPRPAIQSLTVQQQAFQSFVTQPAQPATGPAAPTPSGDAQSVSKLFSVKDDTGSARDNLCHNSAPDTVLTPSSPSKSGNMVHIVARIPGAVCVEDANGLRTLVSLKTNQSRSVHGAPPWRIHFEFPHQAQLYFQGVRLRMPSPHLMAVSLHEGASKPQ